MSSLVDPFSLMMNRITSFTELHARVPSAPQSANPRRMEYLAWVRWMPPISPEREVVEYRIQPLPHYVISTHQLRHSTYQTVTWRRVNFFHD